MTQTHPGCIRDTDLDMTPRCSPGSDVTMAPHVSTGHRDQHGANRSTALREQHGLRCLTRVSLMSWTSTETLVATEEWTPTWPPGSNPDPMSSFYLGGSIVHPDPHGPSGGTAHGHQNDHQWQPIPRESLWPWWQHKS